MWENSYLPEGALLNDDGMTEVRSSQAALERAMAEGRIVEGVVTLCDGALNLWVDLGCMKGIVYRDEVGYSQGGERQKDIAIISRVGKPIAVRIVSISVNDRGEPYAILSRRLAQKECLDKYLYTLKAGDIIPARVTHLEHFGAFVDIGCGIVSLLSIDCISVSRISHPSDRFYIGQHIKTIIKSIRDIIEISSSATEKPKGGFMTKKEREEEILRLEKEMKKAAQMLEFEYAAVLRDRIMELRTGK